MLINQETRKVHQFARQTLRGKKMLFPNLLVQICLPVRSFLHSPGTYWVPSHTRAGVRQDTGCQSPRLRGTSSQHFWALCTGPFFSTENTDDRLKWQQDICKLQVRRKSLQHIQSLDLSWEGSVGLSSEFCNYTNTMTLTEIKIFKNSATSLPSQ